MTRARDTRFIAIVMPLLAVLALACRHSSAPASTPPPAPAEAHAHGGPGGMRGMCPMEVPGTQVAAEDTPDGVAVTFKTTGDVAQLRQRVHAMASKHEEMMMHAGGSGAMPMVPSTARVEDIDGGARIVLTPNDPAQVAQLRDHVHQHANMMASGHCPMMEGAAPSAQR